MISIVFPGQGSQFKGMAQDFYENYSIAKEIFHKVSDATKIDIKDISFNNKENLLNITQYTQICIFTASIAIYEVFNKIFNRDNSLNINYVLGHSLGEYSALVASKVLNINDCSKLLKKRGELMQNAYQENMSGMAAVLGIDSKIIKNIINKNSLKIELSNDNAPGQVVISGIMKDIKNSEKLLLQNGAKKIVYLNVSAAFHSKIMKRAEEDMKLFLSKCTFRDSIFPLISNFTATPSSKSNIIFENLSQQMSNMVRWRESIMYLEQMKEKIVIEVGPGKVLSGLIRRISNTIKVYNLNTIDDISKIKNDF